MNSSLGPTWLHGPDSATLREEKVESPCVVSRARLAAARLVKPATDFTADLGVFLQQVCKHLGVRLVFHPGLVLQVLVRGDAPPNDVGRLPRLRQVREPVFPCLGGDRKSKLCVIFSLCLQTERKLLFLLVILDVL